MARKKSFEHKIPVIFFKEGASFVAYTPAFDLATAGSSFEQAQRRIHEAVDIFLEELVDMGTLDEVLSELGWERVKGSPGHWKPPVVVGRTEETVRIPIAV